MNFPLLSTFLLGALHSLEPGHGKSIVALHTAQSRKISDGFSLLASLLLSHFLLVVAVSTIIYFNPSLFEVEWVKFLAPGLIIFYGLFLLIKSRRNSDEYIACSCSHDDSHDEKKGKSPILMGVMAGLTPCPSVFSPIVMAMTLHQIDKIFIFLLVYISGVVSLFIVLITSVYLLKKTANNKIETLISKFNPHLLSGILMIVIGLFYLSLGFIHHH